MTWEEKLKKIKDILAHMIGEDKIEAWLNASHPDLNWKTPNQVMDQFGENGIDCILTMLGGIIDVDVLTLDRLLEKVREVAKEKTNYLMMLDTMLKKVHLETSRGIVTEKTFTALKRFFKKQQKKLSLPDPDSSPEFWEPLKEKYAEMSKFLDRYWTKKAYNESGEIMMACDACFRKLRSKILFRFFPVVDSCTWCGKKK